MPMFFLVNTDLWTASEGFTCDTRPVATGMNDAVFNLIQHDAWQRERDPDNGGSSIEGVDMKDGYVYCMGCVPDAATLQDISVYLWDNPHRTPGEWHCVGCGNLILEDQSDFEKPTTTCWGCGVDFPDGEMVPRPCGEGEYCPTCAKVNAGEFDEKL